MGVSRREAGFTLIEMLVALSVFALAALTLLRLDGFMVGTAADLSARGAAELVVENESVLIATDPNPPTLGTSTRIVENGGRRYSVRKMTAPTPDRRLARVDLLVTELGSAARASRTLVKRVA